MSSLPVEVFRKMVESSFHHTDIKVTIYKRVAHREVQTKRNRNSYAYVVQSDNKDFHNTLKDVKEALVAGGIKEEMKTFRSTRDGKLLLTFEKSEEAASKIEQALETLSADKKFKAWKTGDTDTQILHLKELDALCTREDVLESLSQKLPPGTPLKVGELRPMARSTQAVTITTTKAQAEQLIREKWLRIGIVNGRFERRVQLQKCFKCWGYDHYASKCHGPDRSKLCLKCGKDGHNIKECSNTSYCLLCETQGHAAGSVVCKVFKNSLDQARKREELRIK